MVVQLKVGDTQGKMTIICREHEGKNQRIESDRGVYILFFRETKLSLDDSERTKPPFLVGDFPASHI